MDYLVGVVTFWNAGKGYGFCRMEESGEEAHFEARWLKIPDVVEQPEGRSFIRYFRPRLEKIELKPGDKIQIDCLMQIKQGAKRSANRWWILALEEEALARVEERKKNWDQELVRLSQEARRRQRLAEQAKRNLVTGLNCLRNGGLASVMDQVRAGVFDSAGNGQPILTYSHNKGDR